MRGLAPGEKIKAVDTAHREYKGAFTAFSERGISLETRSGVVEIERARVHRVEIRANSRRVRNIMVGVGIAFDQTLGALFRNEQGESGGARAGDSRRSQGVRIGAQQCASSSASGDLRTTVIEARTIQ